MGFFRSYTAKLPGGVQAPPRADGDVFGAQVGQALRDAGSQVQQVSSLLLEHQQSLDLMNTYREAAQARADAQAQLDEWLQDGQPVSERAAEYLDESVARMREARSTVKGQSLTDQLTANLSADVMRTARRHDAQLVGQAAKDTADELNSVNGNRLQQTPEVFPDVLDENRGFVEALEIPPQMKPALLREMNSIAAKNAVRGWRNMDDKVALEKLESGYFDDHIEPDDRDVLRASIRSEANRRREDERIQRQEFERQKKITSDQTMHELIIGIGDAENPLSLQELEAVSRQMFEDGDPIIGPSQHLTLRRLIADRAAGRGVKTSPEALVFLTTNEDTLTLEDLNTFMLAGELSPEHYTRFAERVQTGDPVLKAARAAQFKSLPSIVGLSMGMAEFEPEYGRFLGQMELVAREREAEYRRAGKSALDYYKDQQFERDAVALTSQLKLGLAGRVVDSFSILRPGDTIEVYGETFRYTGGSRYNLANHEAIEPERAPLPPDVSLRPPPGIDVSDEHWGAAEATAAKTFKRLEDSVFSQFEDVDASPEEMGNMAGKLNSVMRHMVALQFAMTGSANVALAEAQTEMDRIAFAVENMGTTYSVANTARQHLEATYSFLDQVDNALKERLLEHGAVRGPAPPEAVAPGAQAVGARGFESNNPMNLRATETPWQGKNTPKGNEFESFETLEDGVRAGIVNLRTYFYNYGLRSIEQIINRWAPPHENPTDKYIDFVARAMDVPPEVGLSAKEFEEFLPLMAEAIIQFETGARIDPGIIDSAIERIRSGR